MRIEIEVDGRRPLSGRVGWVGREPVSFVGWLPLLRELELLVGSGEAAAERFGGELAAGADADLAEDV